MLGSYVARLAITSAGSLMRGKGGMLEELRVPFRAWPSDIDIYGHINNGRYLTLMDNGRLDFMVRTGMLKLLFARRWQPLLGAAVIKFHREVKPLAACELVTRFIHWDEKWFFCEHRLEVAGKRHAVAMVKGIVKRGRETIPPRELFLNLGLEEPPLPPLDDEQERFRAALS